MIRSHSESNSGPFWSISSFTSLFSSALTLASIMGGLLTLSNWAKIIFAHWIDMTHFVWRHILWFAPQLSRLEAVLMTFWLLLSASIIIAGRDTRSNERRADNRIVYVGFAVGGVMILSTMMSLGLLNAFAESMSVGKGDQMDIVRLINYWFNFLLNSMGLTSFGGIVIYKLRHASGAAAILTLSEVISDFLMLSSAILVAGLISFAVRRRAISALVLSQRLWLIIGLVTALLGLAHANALLQKIGV